MFLMVLSAFSEQAVNEKVTLKYKFQPGKSYVYTQEMDGEMEMKSPFGEGKMKIVSDVGMDFTYVAEEHAKGVKATMTVDNMRMKSGAEGMMMEYDSSKESEEGDPLATAFAPVLEMECYTIFDKDGKPLEFGGIEDMAGAEQMGMDSEMFEQMFNSSYEMLPKDPVAVGDTWTAEQEIPMGKMGPPLKMNLQSKLEAIEELDGHKVAVISYVADMDMKMEPEEGAPVSIDTKSMSGKYWHDLEENVTRKTTMEMEMVIGVPAGVEVKENGMGEMPYNMVVTQTLVEIK